MDVDISSRAAATSFCSDSSSLLLTTKDKPAQIQTPTEDGWNSLRIALHAKPRQFKVKAVGKGSVGAEAILSVDYMDGSFEAQF